MIVCPRCDGSGKVSTNQCDKCKTIKYNVCPVCEGRGMVYAGVQVGFRQYIYF